MRIESPLPLPLTPMTCKKCNAEISEVVAAETTRKMKAICQAHGLSAKRVDAVVEQQGPLCRTCLTNWGSGEDALSARP